MYRSNCNDVDSWVRQSHALDICPFQLQQLSLSRHVQCHDRLYLLGYQVQASEQMTYMELIALHFCEGAGLCNVKGSMLRASNTKSATSV